MQDPYPHHRTDEPEQFEVRAKLNLRGGAEFTGVRHHPHGSPTSGLRVCGVDIEFVTPDEADRFASAAQVMAAQMHIAWERNGLLPRSEPTPSAYPL
ncbi:hypothetical protein [Streptosporangium sp. NPDC004631]